MKCRYCGKLMNDLSHGKGLGRHWICQNSTHAIRCGAHYYQRVEGIFSPNPTVHDPKWFTGKEWEAYVER